MTEENDELTGVVQPSPEESEIRIEIDHEGRLMSPAIQLNRLRKLSRHFDYEGPTVYGDVIDAASDLNPQLENLRRQVAALQESEHATKEQIEELAGTANFVADRGEELTARVLLPRPEHMAVQLVPSYSLERLEEYRSDRSIALLLFGLFGGAVLGILSNWATDEQFIITRFSGVLMGLLGVLATGSIIWSWRIARRIAPIKRQMFHEAVETKEANQ